MCPFNDALKGIGASSNSISTHAPKTSPNEGSRSTDIHIARQAKPTAFSAIFSTVAYFYMFAVFVLTFLFTFIAPTSIGSYLPFRVFDYNVDQDPTDVAPVTGIATNVGLFLVFGFFHSLFARNSVKQWMKISTTMERPFFVLQAAVLVHLLMHFWKGFESPLLWSIQGTAQYAIMALQVSGLLFLLTATFALDHFHLFGLSQGYGVDINKIFYLSTGKNEDELAVRWHYALVAHPLMTGILLALWAVPRMTGSRFLLAAICTLYILFAVKYLEEPQIQQMMGEDYTEYLKKVPRYIPFTKPAIAATIQAQENSSDYSFDVITGKKTKAV